MKNVVDLQGWGEVEAKCDWIDFLDDCERSKAFKIKFARGSICLDISSKEPDLVANFKGRWVVSMFVSKFLRGFLCQFDLRN